MNVEKKDVRGRYFNILTGPSRSMIFNACEHACEDVQILLCFTVAAICKKQKRGEEYKYVPMDISDFRICGIEHYDDSGNNFIINGGCKADPIFTGKKTYRFKAYYDTERREGRITFFG